MKANVFFLSVVFLLGLMTSSCEFEEPDIGDLKNVELIKMEGNTIDFQFDVDVDNPNGFNFKIKDGDVDIKINEEEIGTIKLSEKIKVKRKTENTYTVPLRLQLNNGIMFKLIQIALQEKLELKAVGTVKGSVLGISKKIPINETKNLKGSDLKGLLQ